MHTHADKTQKNKSLLDVNPVSQKTGNEKSALQFADNRSETVAQKKLQQIANSGSQAKQLKAFQKMATHNRQQIIQKKENNTGLPDNLKAGIENLSGYSMDDVKVHRNSNKPAQLHAHAYAQGTEIHLGPGQEKHLPHEAWHVVQQKQGRVKPTMQMKNKVNINDDVGLEREADLMGAKAISSSHALIEPHKIRHVIQQKNVQPDHDIRKLKTQRNSTNSGSEIIQRRIVLVEPDPDWIMLRNAHVLSEKKGGGKIQHLFENPSLADIGEGEFLYLVGHGNSKVFGKGVGWKPEAMAQNLSKLKLPITHRYILLSGVCESASGDKSFAETLKTTLTNDYQYKHSVVIGAVGLAIAGFENGWQDTVVKPKNKSEELALEELIMKEKGVSEGITQAKAIISQKKIPDISERAAVISKLVGPFYVRLAEEHAKKRLKGEALTFDKNDPNARVGFYT